ncbi:MAG: IS110 family transposase [Alteromonadaceae bacterium]|nr:IS110 family transposase [Alteromonadaceae bacterium]
MKVTLIGIDLAKSVFQVCGVNQAGKPVFNRQVRRNKLLQTLLNYPEASVAMEACSGSNYWGRELRKHGFKVFLIPPQHVKPFVKGNKNDRNDAFAITEAARRPRMQFVEPRTLEQTDLLVLHKVIDRKVQARTALTNQIRGLLNEYGIVVSPGKERLLKALPELLGDGDNGLTAAAREVLNALLDEWHAANQQIQAHEAKLKRTAKQLEPARRLMAVKGVAEKTATAMVGFAGEGKAFKSGRHFAANLGLVPSEHSSGGRQKLGGITRRGNNYLRRLLVQGAWSVIRYADRSTDRLSRWAANVMERRGKHKAVVAVANKLARILWAMLYHRTEYRPG